MEKYSSWNAHLAGWMTAIFGGVTLEKFAMIIGILTSLGTFLVNLYYKRLEAERDAFRATLGVPRETPAPIEK